MKSRIFWILVGMIFWGLLIPISLSFKYDYEVYKKGIIVDAVIIKVPVNHTSRTDNITFDINGHMYTKKVYAGYSNLHHAGEVVELKYLPGNDHVLFPNESPKFWGIFTIILIAILGGWCFYYAYINKSLSRSNK